MPIRISPVIKSVARVVWHTVRYGIATTISTALSAIVPVLIGSTPLLFAILLVLSWIAGLVIYPLVALIDPAGAGVADLGDPMLFVLGTLFLSALGIASIIAALLATLTFGLVGILPTSLLTEFICWQLSIRNAFARLVAFILAGGLLAVVSSGLVFLLNQIAGSELEPTPLALVIAIVALISISSVFTSGLILTSLTGLKNIAVRIINWAQARKLANNRTG